MGYFTHQDRNDIEFIMRIFLFFFSLLLIFLGLFGKTPLPDSIESVFNFLNNLATRGLMVIVGLILLILTINPDAISGRVGLSKKF